MPRFDGTGPTGTGPIGRRMGPCEEGYLGGGRGRGFFRGGFGWGKGQTDAQQSDIKAAVIQRKAWLENQMAVISQHLQDLDKE